MIARLCIRRMFQPWVVLLAGAVSSGCVAPHSPTSEATVSSASAFPSLPSLSALPSASSSAAPVKGALPPEAGADEASYPPPPPPDPPLVLKSGGKGAVRGEAGLVTTVERHATRIGADVLRRGGNAVDAAVAIAYALAVTHPSAGNIGGGGFMIVRPASGETHAVDFRETAPAAATSEKMMAMLKNDDAIGYRSAAVPGTVAGMSLALSRFGTRPLAELLAPAIALAKKGHRIGPRQALTLSWNWPKLQRDATARAIYGRGKDPLKEGELLRQPDLARTLEAIAAKGPSGFYEGPVAEKIDKAMRANGGYLSAGDLGSYQAKFRKPLRFSYRGFTVETMPPPSMGGIAFAQIMLALERARAFEVPVDSGLALHVFIEASRRGYADRRAVGADPDFMNADTEITTIARLLSGKYLHTRKPPIDRDRATPSTQVAPPPDMMLAESQQTTHFSVIDAAGNAVACTVTLSAGFGSKVVIPGTGILLSNAFGAFSEHGVNTVAPGKRMASSMTPAIVSQNDRTVLVLGSPGGDTIPDTMAQVLRNLVDYGMTIDQASARGRIVHPWLPDKVRVEAALAPAKHILDDLVRRGHTIELDPMPIGDAKNILIDGSGTAFGYADSREGGTAEGVAKREIAASAAR